MSNRYMGIDPGDRPISHGSLEMIESLERRRAFPIDDYFSNLVGVMIRYDPGGKKDHAIAKSIRDNPKRGIDPSDRPINYDRSDILFRKFY